MAARKKAKGKRSAAKRSAPVLPKAKKVVGAIRAKAAGLRKTAGRFFDRQGKRISSEVARQRVLRREAREAREAERRAALEARRVRRAKARVAKEEKKPRKRPVPPQFKERVRERVRAAARKPRRDSHGRFISYEEHKRQIVERRIERVHRKQRIEEGQKKREEFAISVKLHNKLCKEFTNISKLVRKAKLGLKVETICASAGATFDAMVEISGFEGVMPSDPQGAINEKVMRRVKNAISDALREAQRGIRKRRGLLVAVSLLPVETLLALYGRDVPLMTTRWMRADHPEEIKNLMMRMKKMLSYLWGNRWEVEKLQLKFRYYHEVAVRGYMSTPETGELEPF